MMDAQHSRLEFHDGVIIEGPIGFGGDAVGA
jgi:hypothetical protein